MCEQGSGTPSVFRCTPNGQVLPCLLLSYVYNLRWQMKKMTLFLFLPPPLHISGLLFTLYWVAPDRAGAGFFLFGVSAYLMESHTVPSSDGDGNILPLSNFKVN